MTVGCIGKGVQREPGRRKSSPSMEGEMRKDRYSPRPHSKSELAVCSFILGGICIVLYLLPVLNPKIYYSLGGI